MPFLDANLSQEETGLLDPRPDMSEDKRAARLKELGWIPVLDVKKVPRLATLGATFARVHATDRNTLWPEQRGACVDGMVRYVVGADMKLYELVESTIEQLAGSSDDRIVTALQNKLAEGLSHRGLLTDERRAALETIMRLGSAHAILTFLEADGW